MYYIPEESHISVCVCEGTLYLSRTMAQCTKAGQRDAHWFESPCRKKFSHVFLATVWDRCPSSIMRKLDSYEKSTDRHWFISNEHHFQQMYIWLPYKLASIKMPLSPEDSAKAAVLDEEGRSYRYVAEMLATISSENKHLIEIVPITSSVFHVPCDIDIKDMGPNEIRFNTFTTLIILFRDNCFFTPDCDKYNTNMKSNFNWQSSTVTQWTKAVGFGSGSRDTRWFESLSGKKFPHGFRPVYGSGAHPAS
ncbi:hypothetical protein C0J52_05592 [Blattella germanica]|nr:hypothetical protein C0J52_05592 [Blattella germanica]